MQKSIILAAIGSAATLGKAQHLIELPPIPGDQELVVVDLGAEGAAVLGISWNSTRREATPALWRPGIGTEPLPHVFGAEATDVYALSADGRYVVGRTIDPATERVVAVRWTIGSEFEVIRPPAGYAHISAFEIDDDGRIMVGVTLREDGTVRGWYGADAGNITLLQPPDGFEASVAMAVDATGRNIAGYAQASDGTTVPCIWNVDTGLEVLPIPVGADIAYANGISGDGRRAIGSSFDGIGTLSGYVWDRDEGILDLNLGDEPSGVDSISRNGQFLVWYDFGQSSIYEDQLGLVNVRAYLEARGLARQLPDFFGASHISPDGSTLAISYRTDERPYVSALITNFTLPTDCPADIDLNEQLDTFDFLAFMNRFNEGDLRADLDGDGALTIADFLAFQTAFDAGC